MPTTMSIRTPHQNQESIQQLLTASSAGLVQMYDTQRNLFCSRMVHTANGMKAEGISHRYSLITLMGLLKFARAGGPVPNNMDAALGALVLETSWVASAGDLGLLLWLCSLAAPERIEQFFAIHNLSEALERFPDASERKTMELSWILAGLAHATLARPELSGTLTPLARKIFAVIEGNRGAHGIFGHQAQQGGAKGLVRGRFGSFADQVYPIYAFAWASRAFGWREALLHSLASANAICKAQGELGQWWWHYDAKTGEAVGKYPVYSVHQHGMAPMALFALHDVAEADYQKEIYRGLEWIYGQNELNMDMRDTNSKVVWRCIRPTKSRRYLDQALAILSPGHRVEIRNLRVLKECWPYELGWLLFSFAGRQMETE